MGSKSLWLVGINKIIFSRIKISIKNVPLKNLVISCKPNLQISMLTEQIVVLTDFDEAHPSPPGLH